MNLKNIYRLYNTTRYFKVKFIFIFFVVGKRMKNKKKIIPSTVHCTGGVCVVMKYLKFVVLKSTALKQNEKKAKKTKLQRVTPLISVYIFM